MLTFESICAIIYHMQSKNTILPHEDSERNKARVLHYITRYFPNAHVAKSIHSYNSNLKHSGDEGMVWDVDASIGDGNQICRHLIDFEEAYMRGDKEEAVYHLCAVAWRSDELLERFMTSMEPFGTHEINVDDANKISN